MAPKPDRLAFIIFGMALAMAVTILAMTTWPNSDSAAPIAPTETIYRPQHWNLY